MTRRPSLRVLLASVTATLGACTSATGGSGDAGAPDAGAPDASECASYLSEKGSAVTITVKNHRATAVYLQDGNCSSRFDIVAPSVTPKWPAELPRNLDSSCDAAQRGAVPWECDFPGVVQLAPAATATFAWSGLLYELRTMPATCFGPAVPPVTADSTCLQGVVPKAGAFQAQVSFFDAADCPDAGACQGSGTAATAGKGFNYPSDQQVEIDID